VTLLEGHDTSFQRVTQHMLESGALLRSEMYGGIWWADVWCVVARVSPRAPQRTSCRTTGGAPRMSLRKVPGVALTETLDDIEDSLATHIQFRLKVATY